MVERQNELLKSYFQKKGKSGREMEREMEREKKVIKSILKVSYSFYILRIYTSLYIFVFVMHALLNSHSYIYLFTVKV